ncbi:MAG TPA: aminotransferase class V-fold PLP-dependent enzyme, partial [Longimicrobiales bacterium]|nr:aminotransferase class V-fold PLP-dependent enzyme [Longimicrobiales bacterium]
MSTNQPEETPRMEHEHRSLDLPPDRMREMGYAVVDRLVDRIAGVGDAPAWQGATREEMRRRLGDVDPADPVPFDTLLDQLFGDVLPYATRTDHPRFFAFIPSCPTWPGILGDLIAAGSAIYPGTWIGSAGYSSLELEVLGWFREWIGYPAESAGLLMSGGSMANLTALVAARDARLGEDWRGGVLYTSSEAHSSVVRAARVLGFAEDRIRVLPADEAFRLDPAALADVVKRDRAAGLRPFFVAANAGATSTGAIDPLPALADLCDREGLWLHVDGAYGGFAVLTERGASLLEGLDRADSVTLDPHKWLYQPFEAGCLLVRDGHDLLNAFRVGASYLQDTTLEAGTLPDAGEVNFGDRGPQLTREARALKVWLSVRSFGLDRIRHPVQDDRGHGQAGLRHHHRGRNRGTGLCRPDARPGRQQD